MFSQPVKRVAALHDLSGVGRVSLTAVIPVLSAMGFQVCPLPTAVLSSHTQFPDYRMVDLTPHIEEFFQHWKTLGMEFDCIYSGFLGSPAQAELLEELMDSFRKPEQLIVVDPVLGDNGMLYASLSSEMIGVMQRLINKAYMITPNITELCLLSDVKYSTSIRLNEIEEMMFALAQKGPRYVVVTSVPVENHPEKTSVIAYEAEANRFWKLSCDYMPASYPGTGDVFTSVLTGALLQGDSLPIALDRATGFILQGVRATFGYQYDARQGILLERVLKYLDAPYQTSSYQMLPFRQKIKS
jgi:pyridoxine kinase